MYLIFYISLLNLYKKNIIFNKIQSPLLSIHIVFKKDINYKKYKIKKILKLYICYSRLKYLI